MREINLLYGVPLNANISENIVKTQLKTEFAQKGIDINEIYISFTKKNIATMLSDKEKAIDVAVIAEFLERDGMKESEISSLLEINEDITIIPIIEAKHKGDAFLKNLFANGVYNCIRNDEDNIIDLIVSLIHSPRKISKAREYYCLAKNEDFAVALETATSNVAPAKSLGKKDRKKKTQEEAVVLTSPSAEKKESVPEIKKEDNVIKVQKVSVQEDMIIADREEKKESVMEEKKPSLSGASDNEPIKVKREPEPVPVKREISISNSDGSNVVMTSRKISKSEKAKDVIFLILKILFFIIFSLSITLNIMLLSSETVRDILYYTFFGGGVRI